MSANDHVIIFPFMAQGHTLPLLDLAKAFALNHNLNVTIITTPSNAKSISDYISPLHFPTISLSVNPFPPIDGLPPGTENTSQLPSMQKFYVPFLHATKKLKQPFEQILATHRPRPLCVISDFFLGWTLDTCRAFGIPRLVFHGMSVCSLATIKSLWCAPPELKMMMMSPDKNQPLDLPNMKLPFALTAADVPAEVMVNSSGEEDPLTKYIEEVGWADANSWGIIVNSFHEVELSHTESFEKFYFNGAKTWCLGPLFLCEGKKGTINPNAHANSSAGSDELSRWLDEQVAPGSVIYVSFGSQADMSSSQLDEVAYGLEASGCRFVWVVRSKSWMVPDGLEEKIKEKGLVVREWVDQRRILDHRSVGEFLSHCGWNSILESVSAGMPILAWPMMAEQALNAKLIVEGLGAGLRLEKNKDDSVNMFKREAICEGVRELMGGGKGRHAKERAQALGRVAHKAVQKGGSSHEAMSRLVNELRQC
uniref:UDP-glycosyltransferase 1 n=1 Tax=Linum usitatissimum TaxID=4006 RepID=I2BHE8_LINUS|nr:UDP-glycosyltransferase 1 [Linum usitatissimum]